MKKETAKPLLYLSIVALAVFLFDVITKQIIRINDVQTSGHILDITYRTNVGSMFSFFIGVTAINIIFIVLSFLALGFLFYYARTQKKWKFIIPLGFLFGGIVGNLFDRIFFSSVIDWIDFHFWPIFNIADCGIVLGVILLIWFTLEEEKKKR